MNKALFLAVQRAPVPSRGQRFHEVRCTTTDNMDKASKVLTQAPPEVCGTWAAIADWGGVSTTTLYKRAHGQASIEDKARGQQYLTVEEEKALVGFLLLMSSFGQPVRIKYGAKLSPVTVSGAYRMTAVNYAEATS